MHKNNSTRSGSPHDAVKICLVGCVLCVHAAHAAHADIILLCFSGPSLLDHGTQSPSLSHGSSGDSSPGRQPQVTTITLEDKPVITKVLDSVWMSYMIKLFVVSL